jgi:ATP-binding cassette, subfamily B, multidrug efflux pump
MKKFITAVLPYYKPYKWKILMGILFVMLTNGFIVLGPWVLRIAINGLKDGVQPSKIWTYAGLIVGVALIASIFRFLMRKTIISASRYMEYDMRQTLFKHMLILDPSFYDHSKIGDLMTRSTSDIEQVRMVIGPGLMYAINTTFGFIFGITLMLTISIKMTLLVLMIAPIISVLVFFLSKLTHKASMESQEAFSALSATVQENLSGIRVVKAFQQSETQKALFDKNSSILKSKNMVLVFVRGAFFPIIMVVFGLAIAGIMLVGGWEIINGKQQIGDFVAFTSYLMILTWPIVTVGWVVTLFQRGRASMERIDEILNLEPDLQDSDEELTEVDDSLKGSVSYKNLGFTYPKSETPVFNDITFDLKKGNTLGIVGRVGTGKSTIASLLVRLYEATSGQIEVDGVDIRRWKKFDLRERIALVPQDPLLFSTTIRENIALGIEYSEDEINQAVEISRLVQDLEDFPHGLETEIGERGVTLSGGQKQRVAIARAVIRRPEIILFDDALSAVDADTEEQIVKNLNRFLKGRTSIIITHRISSVIEANEIIVIDNGDIVERGTHSELVKSGGIYTNIFQMQKLRDELEGVE